MKISDKDIKFLIWTAVASLLLMAFLQLFAARAPSGETYDVEDKPVTEAEQKQAFQSLVMLDEHELKKLLAPKKFTPTFVMIYASWCPHCRQALPDMLNLKQKGFFKHARTLFISIDEKPEKLARYLSQPAYKDAFTPYIVKPEALQSAYPVFTYYGFHYNGGIPYAILYDGDGNRIAETDSNGHWDDLLAAIKELK